MEIPKYITEIIETKFINIGDYNFEQNHKTKIKLSDQIVLYNISNQWKVIPLLLLLAFPIIYDEYIENTKAHTISIVLCPVTMRSNIFMGKFIFHSYYGTTMILKEEHSETIMPITSGIKINEKLIVNTNKRFEIKIMTLKNALMMAPDLIFIQHRKKLKPIINLSYYSNKKDINNNDLDLLFHPKTLVYIVQYKSYKTGNEKTSILMGNDSTRDNVGGYDLKKSKLFEYLNKYQQKIINREGYLYPILWYIAKDEYPQAKIIFVS
jgi:hypothetical protein